MAKSLRFTVKGSGPFPVDMLRYDSCWPTDTDSAVNISRCSRCDEGARHGTREVRLAMQLEKGWKSEPTVDRWRSFGWAIVAQRKF